MAGQIRIRPFAKDRPPKIANCPWCDETVLVGTLGPVAFRISRISISERDARVLIKYGHCVYNVWPGAHTGWLAADWLGNYPLTRGRLYTDHDCTAWK